MNRLMTIFLLCVLGACTNETSTDPHTQSTAPVFTEIVSEDYVLITPQKQDRLLILFPCYPCDAENTRAEFNISDIAMKHNIAVMFMNFHQHLWLSDSEKKYIENILLDAVTENNIDPQYTYIGGFSSGGNVSFLMADYLASKGSSIQPKGLFIADSPLDLHALYENAERTLRKNFSSVAVQEANWIIETLNTDFGVGDTSLPHYTQYSPYIFKTHSTRNISQFNGVKIRLYSEPDTLWWKENRQAEYENMNAYYIEQLTHDLHTLYGEDNITFIKTEDRGYRANGDRHPHSWAIVDEKDLVNWIRAN